MNILLFLAIAVIVVAVACKFGRPGVGIVLGAIALLCTGALRWFVALLAIMALAHKYGHAINGAIFGFIIGLFVSVFRLIILASFSWWIVLGSMVIFAIIFQLLSRKPRDPELKRIKIKEVRHTAKRKARPC